MYKVPPIKSSSSFDLHIAFVKEKNHRPKMASFMLKAHDTVDKKGILWKATSPGDLSDHKFLTGEVLGSHARLELL